MELCGRYLLQKTAYLENIISPLSAFFGFELVANFYEDAFDEAVEGGLLETELSPFDYIQIRAADDPEEALEFQDIKSFGDNWKNDFKSTCNLFH